VTDESALGLFQHFTAVRIQAKETFE